MTHATKIVACSECRPDENNVSEAMARILIGALDENEELCQKHREEMEKATREWRNVPN